MKRKEEIDNGYTKSLKEEEYCDLWRKAEKIETDMKDAGEPESEIAKTILNGLWALYYYARKFARTPENIDILAGKTSFYYLAVSRFEDPKLKVAYGYLLEVINNELRENLSEAERLGEEVRRIAEETGESGAYLKEINARGLRIEKEGNLEEAIKVFGEAEEKFPGAADVPEAQLDFAHCMNNQAKCRILLSDTADKPQRIDLLKLAVGGLLNALDIYRNVPPSHPIKHIEGVINRLIMAAIRVLSYYDSTKYENEVKTAFEARKTNKAIDKIAEAFIFVPIDELKIILKGIYEAQKIIAEQKKEK